MRGGFVQVPNHARFAEMHTARGSHAVVGVRPLEPEVWDDLVLAGLLMVIGVPRAILAVIYEHPTGAEGTLSLLCVALGLLVLLRRNARPRRRRTAAGSLS